MNAKLHWPDERHPHAGPGKGKRARMVDHPLFPAILVLWFAAPLAFIALALPASLLEHAAAAIRLDALVPAARPPLGFTARALLAFALALGGGLGGWLTALVLRRRTLASVDHADALPMEAKADTAAPLVSSPVDEAQDDDGDDLARLAAARANLPQRRRALTSETAEVPGILEISAISALEPLGAGTAAAEPIAAEAEQPAWAPAPVSSPVAGELSGEAAMRLCAAPLETLGVPQLVERFALALKARRLREADERASRGQRDPLPPAQPVTAPFAEPRDMPAHTGARPFDLPASHQTLMDTGPLATRRPLSAAELPVDPTTELARWSLPEPEGEGDDVDEELWPDPAATQDYSSLTDLRPATRVPAPLADFVRVDEPDTVTGAGAQPVVVFPGQAVPAPPLPVRLPGTEAPANAEETEQALREALAALQRLSGTG